MRFLVLDIETIRDERVWSPPPLQLEIAAGQLFPRPREVFAPPFAWRPIVIAFVLFETDGKSPPAAKRLGTIGAPEGLSDDAEERAILDTFSRACSNDTPKIITWNGRGFDLPVIMTRSMRHAISQSWYYGNRENRYRYSEDGHCDLMDAASDYGATKPYSLDGMAKLIGMPGKFGGIDGDAIAAAYSDGRHAEIAAYCLSDAVQTSFLWLRWLLLKGEFTPEQYAAAAGGLMAMCEQDARLAEFVKLVDRGVLLPAVV